MVGSEDGGTDQRHPPEPLMNHAAHPLNRWLARSLARSHARSLARGASRLLRALIARRACSGAGAAFLAGALVLATPAVSAQDYDGLIRQALARQNAAVNQAQNQVQRIVAQRMQDPVVQAAYRRYVHESGGRPAMDYPTYAYYHVYTNGFSAQGMAHMRANEGVIQQREAAAWQGVRQAEAQRAQAQQQHRDGYHAQQQEAGRRLMGQSTYVLPNGQGLQLPHTWPANSTHRYQGQTYHVDAGGRYHVLAGHGAWYPLAAGR